MVMKVQLVLIQRVIVVAGVVRVRRASVSGHRGQLRGRHFVGVQAEAGEEKRGVSTSV